MLSTGSQGDAPWLKPAFVEARLTLVNVRPFVSGVLNVTRLDTLLDVRPAGEQAAT